jgi:hypothetical protein
MLDIIKASEKVLNTLLSTALQENMHTIIPFPNSLHAFQEFLKSWNGIANRI